MRTMPHRPGPGRTRDAGCGTSWVRAERNPRELVQTPEKPAGQSGKRFCSRKVTARCRFVDRRGSDLKYNVARITRPHSVVVSGLILRPRLVLPATVEKRLTAALPP